MTRDGGDVPNATGSAPATVRLATICIDCADADAMADFYARLLGWNVTLREPNWALMQDPTGGVGLSFQAEANYRPPVWPEQPGKVVSTRAMKVGMIPKRWPMKSGTASGAGIFDHAGFCGHG